MILSLLNKHPVSLCDNLLKICNALSINVSSQKLTIVKMQVEIEECIKTYPNYEATVRNMARDMLAKHKICLSSHLRNRKMRNQMDLNRKKFNHRRILGLAIRARI